METAKMIITFSCQKTIHVYKKGCGRLPHPPYKQHSSVKDAQTHMIKDRGISNPQIIVNE